MAHSKRDFEREMEREKPSQIMINRLKKIENGKTLDELISNIFNHKNIENMPELSTKIYALADRAKELKSQNEILLLSKTKQYDH